jgi:hypothetical protein
MFDKWQRWTSRFRAEFYKAEWNPPGTRAEAEIVDSSCSQAAQPHSHDDSALVEALTYNTVYYCDNAI